MKTPITGIKVYVQAFKTGLLGEAFVFLILSVPNDFFFPDQIAETKRTYMLGNSVDCRVVKAIRIEAALHLMMDHLASAGRPAPAARHLAEDWLTILDSMV